MNFYHELGLESVLQCPVCMELPTSAIFLCKIGHHVCGECRKRLESCPTCKSALTSCRSFLAEELIAKVAIFKDGSDDISVNNEPGDQTPCNSKGQVIEGSITADIPNREDEYGRVFHIVFEEIMTEFNGARSSSGTRYVSANATDDPDLLRNNASFLKPLKMEPGAYKCLLESCPNGNSMGVGKMYSHIRKAHSRLYEKFHNNLPTFQHSFEHLRFSKGRRVHSRVMHISNMGLFFIIVKVSADRYINCWISTPVPTNKTDRFEYALEFVNETNDISVQFCNKVASNQQGLDWLLQRGKVFVIPPIEHLIPNRGSFSLRVKIYYDTGTAGSS